MRVDRGRGRVRSCAPRPAVVDERGISRGGRTAGNTHRACGTRRARASPARARSIRLADARGRPSFHARARTRGVDCFARGNPHRTPPAGGGPERTRRTHAGPTQGRRQEEPQPRGPHRRPRRAARGHRQRRARHSLQPQRRGDAGRARARPAGSGHPRGLYQRRGAADARRGHGRRGSPRARAHRHAAGIPRVPGFRVAGPRRVGRGRLRGPCSRCGT